MIKIKAGVRLHGLTPQILIGLAAAECAYSETGYDVVITSGVEAKHKALKSKHYTGNAIDLRINHIMDPLIHKRIVKRLQDALPGFNVILESDHIHMEWDPTYDGGELGTATT